MAFTLTGHYSIAFALILEKKSRFTSQSTSIPEPSQWQKSEEFLILARVNCTIIN